MIDTESDISRRYGLASSAYNKLEKNSKSKSVSQKQKIRALNAYVGNIFLYNSELWTTTSVTNNKIDCIQRRFLRRLLGVRWPKVMSNKKINEKTKQKPWSEMIKRKAMRWLGHLLRLNKDTPARRALNEFTTENRRPPAWKTKDNLAEQHTTNSEIK